MPAYADNVSVLLSRVGEPVPDGRNPVVADTGNFPARIGPKVHIVANKKLRFQAVCSKFPQTVDSSDCSGRLEITLYKPGAFVVLFDGEIALAAGKSKVFSFTLPKNGKSFKGMNPARFAKSYIITTYTMTVHLPYAMGFPLRSSEREFRSTLVRKSKQRIVAVRQPPRAAYRCREPSR